MPHTENKRSAGLLDGVIVLDFTHVLAGPFASMILADLGATVIKIERPDSGDPFREGKPQVEGLSHEFVAVNRGKYGVALDLKSDAGRSAALDLAKKADVVLNNYRAGVMEKLGLGANALRQANPKLIFASITGFGQSSSLSHKPAFDPVVQAMAGLQSLVGEPDGVPMRAGVSWGDLQAGVFAAMAIIGALYDRERTGQGQEIDVAMFDSIFFMLSYFVPFYQMTGRLPDRAGAFHQTIVPVGTYPTKDGYISLAPVTDAFWQSFCRGLGKPEWINDDARYAGKEARRTNRDSLIAEICEITRQRTTAEWSKIFDELDFPWAPILTIADLMKLPLVKERGLLADLGVGGLSSPINPFHMSRSQQAVRKPAPRLGADTENILKEMLGYTEDRIKAATGGKTAR